MQYKNSNWVDILNQNHLQHFDDFWRLQLPTVDEGNHGRGGYSIVSRHVITLPNGKKEGIYIKRQENYTCFNWRAPFRGIPTFQREFTNWQQANAIGLSTYDLLYFAKRQNGKQQQAILVSKELPAVDLTTYLASPEYRASGQFNQRQKIIRSIATLLRTLHDAGFQHGHLSPKHIFIGGFPDAIEAYIIDLEVMRKPYWKRSAVVSDLSRFARHIDGGTLTERMWFYRYYLGVERLSPQHKRFWRVLAKQAPQKITGK